MLTALFAGDEYEQELLADYKQEIAAWGEHAAFSFPHFLADFRVIQPREHLLGQGFQFGDKVVLSIKFTEGLVIAHLVYHMTFHQTMGHIDESFYNSLCSVFGNVVENINKSANAEIYLYLKTQLQKLVSETQHIGWGYGIYVSDAYYQIVWRKSDE